MKPVINKSEENLAAAVENNRKNLSTQKGLSARDKAEAKKQLASNDDSDDDDDAPAKGKKGKKKSKNSKHDQATSSSEKVTVLDHAVVFVRAAGGMQSARDMLSKLALLKN